MIFATASCSLLPHPLFLLPLSFLPFPEPQITAPIKTCSYQRLPTWSACKTYSAACLSKQQPLNLLGPCMWMHQKVFLSNPGRPTPVISLPTNRDIPFSTGLTSNPLWPEFSSRERGGCEVFHTPPTSQTGLGLWFHRLCHKAFVGGSSFLSPSLSPRSYGCSMKIMTQYILPFLNQHLPDLEQQSLDVCSVLVGMGLCRREAKRDDKHLMLLETLSWHHWGPSSLCPEAEVILGPVELVIISPFCVNTCQSAYLNFPTPLILLLSPAAWLAEICICFGRGGRRLGQCW